MNQAHLIEELFNNLKDKIEFDEDVVALFQILKKMLKINKEKSIECWYYIMNHYNLKEMRKEINFNPLTNLYLLEILNTHNLNFLFNHKKPFLILMCRFSYYSFLLFFIASINSFVFSTKNVIVNINRTNANIYAIKYR